MAIPPEVLAAIQAKAGGGAPSGPPMPPGNFGGSADGVHTKSPAKKKKKKPVKTTAADKKAALARRMNKNGGKPNPFAGK